jgi:hypothetical protein
MVGDRGMLTSARIEQTLRPAGLDWITALRAPAIRQLADGGLLQFSLFDTRDMAEISSPDYPNERLVVCKNPLLAEERRRKRDELLALTEADLGKIKARVTRAKNKLRGAGEIGKAIGALLARTNETPLLVRIRILQGSRKTYQPRFPYAPPIRQGFPFTLYLDFSVRSDLDSECTEITCFPSSPSSVPRHGSKAFLADFRESLSGLFSVCLLMRTQKAIPLGSVDGFD